MRDSNLFIQRKFQVERDTKTGYAQLIASIYIAYYFYLNNELYVTKYALCVKYSKKEAELKNLIN